MADRTAGIVLLTLNGFEYGYWAYNLAVSIKSFSPDVDIQLITDGLATGDLSKEQMSLFDVVTEIGYMDKMFNGKFEPGWVKANLYKYLVFDRSIYLDVDAVCIKDIMPLFDECKHMHYCTQVTGEGSLTEHDFGMDMYWALPKTIKQYFPQLSSIPFTNSSFQYINKTGKDTKKLFKTMAGNFGTIPIMELNEQWGQSNCHPDELYLNISLALNGTGAKIEHSPVYFTSRWGNGAHSCKTFDEIKGSHYLIGFWGGSRFNHPDIERMYDSIMGKLLPLHKYKIKRLMKQKFININYA